ncbi:MAG: glycosyltransferase family 2 protein [Vulcanisaeta sp.]
MVDPQSLSAIIEYMETDERVAATSGLIFYGDGKTIYSAGGIVTELGNARGVCWMTELAECPSSLKEHYVTYADGAYMVVRTHIIRRMSRLGKPFLDEAFLYFDDYVLGLTLWNRGYKVMYYPVKAGLHYAHKTTKPVINYYGIRAHVALMRILKSRLAPLSTLHILRRLAVHSGLCLTGVTESCSLVRAIYDGFELASIARKKLGPLILYRAPHVASRVNELKCHTLGLCKELLKISHNDIRYLA